jgi:hypothetical protein
MASILRRLTPYFLVLIPWSVYGSPETSTVKTEWLKCEKDSDCGAANNGCAKWVAVNKRFIVEYAGANGYPNREGVRHSDTCLKSAVSATAPAVSCTSKICQIQK